MFLKSSNPTLESNHCNKFTMVDITKDIFASDVDNQRGMIARSVSDNTADSTTEMNRPEKIRRVDESSHRRTVSLFDQWDNEESDTCVSSNDIDVGSDGEIEEFSDEEISDDEFSDDLFAGEDAKELSEETLFELQRMDSDVKSLVIRRISERVDGKEAGRCIGDSPWVKKLTIEAPKTPEWFSQFCTGLVWNRSIDRLSLTECDFDGAPTTITALWPFLELNSNLRSLEIISCHLGDEITRLLALALSRRCDKSTLRQINLEANVIGDESGKELIDVLKGYNNLSELSLGDNEIGTRSCIELSNLLSSPNCNLRKVNLENNSIGDAGITSITNALACNMSLKELCLSLNCRITQAGWQMLSTCLSNRDSALEMLDLSSTNIDDEGAIALGSSLIENKTMKTLNLYDLSSNGLPLITGAGWQGFFACLQNPASALEQIDLRYSSLDNGGLSALTNALANNSSVKMLDLSHNTQITAAEWRSFSACLKCPNVKIEELYLCGNNITDEELTYLAHSLKTNDTLTTLNLDTISSITGAGWAPFSHLLCNKSNIDDICTSNHTLQFLGDQSIPANLESMLQSNEHSNKREVAREKIIKYYFENGDAHVEEFLDMKLKVLPHAICWICSNGSGNSLLYELLKRLPSLFSFVEKVKPFGAKRKRDT